MIDVPALTPVTIPVAFTVATLVATELQDPPAAVGSLNSVEVVGQTTSPPEIAPANGDGFTVTTTDVVAVPQLFVTAYDIIDVPAAIPVTVPVALTVAIPVDTAVQVPPATASLRLVVVVGQIEKVPVMVPAFGEGFTVTTVVAAAVPQLLVTV